MLFDLFQLLWSLSLWYFPSDRDAAAMTNQRNAHVEMIAIGLELECVRFISVRQIYVTYLSMKSVPIRLFTINVSTT